MGMGTLTFDLETGIQVASKLGLWVLEVFGMYAQTDRQSRATLIGPSLRAGHNNKLVA